MSKTRYGFDVLKTDKEALRRAQEIQARAPSLILKKIIEDLENDLRDPKSDEVVAIRA